MPSPATPPPSLSLARILTILGTFAVLGWLVGALVAYLMPRVFESRALLADADRSPHSMQVAPVHAAATVHDLDLAARWGTDWHEAIRRVREDTRLVGSPDGTWIVAEASSPHDAMALAANLAEHFYGREVEVAWSGVLAPDPPDDPLLEGWQEARTLVGLIREALDKAGVAAADQSLESARQLAGTDDDVARQLAMLEDLKQGMPLPLPEDPLRHPAELRVAPAAMDLPVSPNHEAILQGGLWSGIVAGLLVLAALGLWRPDKLRPRGSAVVDPPDWAAEKSAGDPAGDW